MEGTIFLNDRPTEQRKRSRIDHNSRPLSPISLFHATDKLIERVVMHLVKIKSSDSRRENKRMQDNSSFRREKTIFHVYKNGQSSNF